MEYNVLDALAMIMREKQVDREIIIESLEAGLQSAAKKKLGAEAVIEAHVDVDTGEMLVEQVKVVVEEIDDPDAEISLEEAQIEFGDEVTPGDEVRWELPLDNFGRNAILVAKQILVQKVREAERGNIFEDFKDKLDTIISGTIQQVDRGNVLLNLGGRVEAILPFREQIRQERDRYQHGLTLQALVIEVLDNAKGPQVILSRTHPNFLRHIFEREVPEIQDGVVAIKAVAREPGTRSKIAVVSRDDRVDAVGSCVGMKGARVQNVTKELAGERIDIVPWSAEPALLIGRALSPAEVSSIELDEARREATVVVAEDQLSKAIGKEGKNVRLAAKLTEWKIDLIGSREYNTRQRARREITMDLEEMPGVTAKVAAGLSEAGITTIAKLADTTREDLEAIPGIGPKTAESLQATAQATRIELERMVEEAVAEELAQEQVLFDEDRLEAEGEITEEAEAAASDDVATVEVIFDESKLSDDAGVTGEIDEADPDTTPEKIDDPFAGTDLED